MNLYIFAIKLCFQVSCFIVLFGRLTFGKHFVGQYIKMFFTDVALLLISSYLLFLLILNMKIIYQFITNN
jgi:hypothetical protein